MEHKTAEQMMEQGKKLSRHEIMLVCYYRMLNDEGKDSLLMQGKMMSNYEPFRRKYVERNGIYCISQQEHDADTM